MCRSAQFWPPDSSWAEGKAEDTDKTQTYSMKERGSRGGRGPDKLCRMCESLLGVPCIYMHAR